jgi:hypothetical protein
MGERILFQCPVYFGSAGLSPEGIDISEND